MTSSNTVYVSPERNVFVFNLDLPDLVVVNLKESTVEVKSRSEYKIRRSFKKEGIDENISDKLANSYIKRGIGKSGQIYFNSDFMVAASSLK